MSFTTHQLPNPLNPLQIQPALPLPSLHNNRHWVTNTVDSPAQFYQLQKP